MSKLIVVLGSGKYESIRRAKTAAEFYLKNNGCQITCSGSYPHRLPFEKMHQTEAEYAAEEIRNHNIPVSVDSLARNTWESLVNLKKSVDSNVGEIYFVTNSWHSIRTREYAEKLFPQRKIAVLAPKPKNLRDLLSDLFYILLGGI